MFFHCLTLLALSTVASVAGAPSNGPTSINVARSLPPHPQTELKFFTHLVVDLANLRKIAVSEGTRVGVTITGGNWTNPDGTLLANVLGGLGGESGFIDSAGTLHLDVRYEVQFIADSKWGYVQMTGFGTAGVMDKGFITVESDSSAAKGLLDQTFYTPGVFSGNVFVGPNWAFV